MTSRFVYTAVAVLLCGSSAAAESIAFVNVNVITMSGDEVLRARTVVVEDGRIVRIGDVRAIPIAEGLPVVDGTDRYLMPGLAEMHAHVPAADSPELRRVLDLYIANGITLMRGMLGEPSQLELRQKIADGAVLGPRLITSGPSFNDRSVSSPEQAAVMVREQHVVGYDFLKIHPGLTREEFDVVARTANEVGIPFAGHVPADVGVHRALQAGIATIDHLDGYMQTLIPAHEDPTGGYDGFFGLFLAPQADAGKIRAVVAETVGAGVWNVPTESLFEHVTNRMDPDDMKDRQEMRYMPLETVDRWVSAKRGILDDPNYSAAAANRAIELRRKMIHDLYAAGAGLLLGSDSPQIFNVPGFSIHHELQYLVDAGLSPYEALRTGTVNPARFFGWQDSSGTVEVGKVADLVLLDQNPLDDIAASRRVHGVMLRGHWVSNAEIRSMLGALQR